MLDVRVKLDRLERYALDYESGEIKTGKILLYGDSAFTRWQEKWGNIPVESLLLDQNGQQAVVNHGIGGGTMEELLYYYPRLVLPWKPKALVIEAFCNDRDANYSPSEIIYLMARLLEYARRQLPGTRFYLCDARPLSAYVGELVWMVLKNHLTEFNELLGIYCAQHPDCTLIRHGDCPALFEEGFAGDYDHPRKDLFIEDKVHYNPEGYAIYTEFFRQKLADEL